MKAKDNKIDCARGMAAILMVIGHMGLQNGFTQYIYSFHMPLFFFLSGICIGKSNTEESIIKHIVKRTKRLLVPYILFSLIFSVPQYKNYILCFYASRESLYQAGSMTSLWFLPCLFAADCMFYMLRKICGGGGREVLVFSFFQ